MPAEWLLKEELRLKVDFNEITFEAEGTLDGITVHRTGASDFEVSYTEFIKLLHILRDWSDGITRKWNLAKG